MTVTQDTDTTGVAHVLALASALELGLPVPALISIHAVDWEIRLQFQAAGEVAAWAAHSDAEVEVNDSSSEKNVRWHDVYFTYSGVDFHGYAQVRK
jgi:hypothetical protein